MNILFLADPNSIHDIKWMTWFSNQKEYNCYLISRKKHLPAKELAHIELLGGIEDYSIFKPWKNRESKNKINKIIDEKEIDLVHIYYAEPNLLWASVINVPLVLTTRGSDVLVAFKQFVTNGGIKNKILLKYYQNAINKCKVIISTSQKQLDFLVKNFSTSSLMLIVRTGVDIKNILPLEKERKIVFFPRNMQPLYNHELALKVIGRLPKDKAGRYKFVFVNKNSSNLEYVDKIRKLISELNDVKIEFLDSLKGEEYYRMLAKSRVVVMTPNSDGSPVSAMETIATGVPLILPNLEYDIDLFQSAYLYTANNEKSLLNTLVDTLEKEKSIDENYNLKIDRAIEMTKVEKIYNEILDDYNEK